MAANVPLIERTDIHKSCKALEGIVNAFNDYCQAAEALALVQKKLSRALKDAVGLKGVNELAGNALSGVASLLESLAEIDAKFVKIIDKECEGVSSDLKKWFKKLAKEERNHDEKISAANTKIKQAGLAYEKKAKKKDRDAGEEHTRYVNLLGAVGPEMSQERYNHTLFVTQRHNAILYNVASSISRTADAEWTRACDCVRKFAPVIGRIGERRAYLEGGWMLDVPNGNGDHDDKNNMDADHAAGGKDANGTVDEMGVRVAKAVSGSTETDSSVQRSPVPAYSSAASLGTSLSPTSTTSYPSIQSPPSAPPSLPSRSQSGGPPPTSFFPATFERLNTDSVRSIESLSSFPVPPTHFPLPAMTQFPSSPLAQSAAEQRSSQGGEDKSAVDKPRGASEPDDRQTQQNIAANAWTKDATPSDKTNSARTNESERSHSASQNHPSAPVVFPSTNGENFSKQEISTTNLMDRPQSPENRRRDSGSPGMNEVGMQQRKVSGTIERTESVASRGSIVASMRDKWGRGDISSPVPPRERDIPRVPNKVADLASRYVPPTGINSAPLSPRDTGQVSPTFDRPRQVSGPNNGRDNSTGSTQQLNESDEATAQPGPTASEIDIMRRRRRIEELEDLERREQAQALRAREREIEMQTKALERERERLHTLNAASPAKSNGAIVRGHPQHSYSMVNLVPSHSGAGEPLTRPVSHYGEPLAISTSPSSSSSTSNPPSRPDHAPYCGCQVCSASQYNNPNPHVQIVAQPRVQKEKPKGWIRRLSMPVVGNAFTSSDPKKMYAPGASIAGGSLAYLEQDSTGGISNVRPRKISFGRR
ncbi:hypothetical protein ACEPAF_8023 [Sanghuangporus sanghuang]